MGSDQVHVVDPPLFLILKLWFLALLGLVLPYLVVRYWPDMSWAGKAERALQHSLEEKEWKDPWQPIEQKRFSTGWVRCGSLADAVALDRKVDDGNLHEGQLVLSEGGLAWLPQ